MLDRLLWKDIAPPLTLEKRLGRLRKRPIFYESQSLRELELFFAVLFEMSLYRLFRVSSAENYVAPSYVSMVCRLLVTPGLVMLGRFPVVARAWVRCSDAFL
jgi:hypothetical protein